MVSKGTFFRNLVAIISEGVLQFFSEEKKELLPIFPNILPVIFILTYLMARKELAGPLFFENYLSNCLFITLITLILVVL